MERGWSRLPSVPLDPSAGAGAAWTGAEMVVLSRNVNGPPSASNAAAYDPDAGRWRQIAQYPGPGFPARGVVWTGRELLVWETVRRTGTGLIEGERSEGFAYRPDRDEWRQLPDAPLPPILNPTALWTGFEMIVWGGTLRVPSVEDLVGVVTAEGAAFNPQLEQWRSLSPAPLRARTDHSTAWTGQELIVWGGSSGSAEPQMEIFGDGAAYDPRMDRWRSLPPAPVGSRYAHEAIWTGDEMLAWGGITATGTSSTEAAAYRPGQNQWRRLADTPFGRTHGQTLWTGSKGVSALAAGTTVEDLADLVTYDPASDTWDPVRGRRVASGVTVWTGTELLAVGQDPEGKGPTAWTWRP